MSVNAGIGGSCFDDLYRYKEELISATEPDILVIYEGDNDIVHIGEDGGQREVSDYSFRCLGTDELDPEYTP
jgi:hypothetical protein